jgi:FkbM family methyltransferase
MSQIVRGRVRRAVRSVSGATLFSERKSLRLLAFEALGAKSGFVVCDRPGKETYIVGARDEIIGRELFLTGEFDFDKFWAAYELLERHRGGRRPRVLMDVGANIGTICIPAVARGLVERAVAVEPDPRNCRLLRANIHLNGLGERIRVEESAAGSSDGETLQLTLSEHNFGDHRISAAEARKDRQSVSVRSGRLDTLCADLLDQDVLIWMDVQGYEGFALNGAKAFMAKRTPLVIEFFPEALEESGSFPLLTDAVSGYDGFWDLADPSIMYPMAEMDALRSRLAQRNGTTDLLIV